MTGPSDPSKNGRDLARAGRPGAVRKPRPRFTAADIDRMVEALRATGCDFARVAGQFDVSQAYVEKIAVLRRYEIGNCRRRESAESPVTRPVARRSGFDA